jgi:hypothetical protein
MVESSNFTLYTFQGLPLCTNKANLRPTRYPIIPLFYYSTIPIRYRSCKTNPIPRRCRLGRGHGGGGRGAIVQNEPNLPGRPGPRRAKCAKRTQFPAASGGTRRRPYLGRLCETNPISPAGAGLGGRRANVQNEANLRRTGYPIISLFYYSTIPLRCRLCKTNPISRLRIGDGTAAGRLPCGLPPRTCAGRLCKTKPIRRAYYAKQSQFHRSAGAPEGEMCETNPISPRTRRRPWGSCPTPRPTGHRPPSVGCTNRRARQKSESAEPILNIDPETQVGI